MPISPPRSRHLRRGRFSQAGQFYFLTTTVAGRRPIFTEPSRAEIVLAALRWLAARDFFAVDAAVVMPDHLHFVGQLRAGSLAGVMHSLKSFTANELGRTGVARPVWQAGYHDHGLRHDEDYRCKVRYLVDNPVRAGIVRRVQDYPFIILPSWWGGGVG